jgi:alcohol dehydrogenase class IV
MTPGDEAGRIPRFEFASAGRIVFGPGAAADLPAIAASFGRRVLWVCGSDIGRFAALRAAVAVRAESVTVFSCAGEPTTDSAEAAARLAAAASCDVVIAVGGGSVIDCGKAAAALAANGGAALDYLEIVGRGAPLTKPSLPFVAVPTTAGTGSEATRNAVLAVPQAGVKASLRSAHMLPRVALVDPELALGLPPAVTAASGMDALVQLIEPFLSSRAQPVTDALCRDGIGRAVHALFRVFRDPSDLAARAEMALAALYSGMALANAGLGAVHGLAGPIGGMFPAPHGAVCAALLAPVLRANLGALRARAPGHPALARFTQLAGLVGAADGAPDSVAPWCAALAERLRIPPLAHWGITERDLPEIARRAAEASSMKANPIPLSLPELEGALRAALHGSAAPSTPAPPTPSSAKSSI